MSKKKKIASFVQPTVQLASNFWLKLEAENVWEGLKEWLNYFHFIFLPSPNWLTDWLLQTFFRAKDAVWPPRTSLTGILLRWMDLTAMGMKVPSGSGPKSSVSLSRIIPRNVVPETTVPTPCQRRSTMSLKSLLPFCLCGHLQTVSISLSLQAYSSLHIMFVQWGFPTWKNKYKNSSSYDTSHLIMNFHTHSLLIFRRYY